MPKAQEEPTTEPTTTAPTGTAYDHARESSPADGLHPVDKSKRAAPETKETRPA
jgi:hypothetical protein